jgi:PAS domain S-box-containing protein
MPLMDPAFRAIFENAPVGIVVVDRELRVVDVNAAYCEMLGYSRDELLSLHVPDLTHPEDRQQDIEFLPLLLKGQIPHYRTEKRYITKNKETVWAHLTATALRDATGHASYAFGITENITDRKILRQILPLCSSCKKVRDEKGFWTDVEVYLRERASTEVSHGLCPECARKKPAE